MTTNMTKQEILESAVLTLTEVDGKRRFVVEFADGTVHWRNSKADYKAALVVLDKETQEVGLLALSRTRKAAEKHEYGRWENWEATHVVELSE